jgi:hypothetical protein
VEALSRPDLSRHQSRSQNLDDLGTRYLLIEYIEEAHGGMVSCTRKLEREEPSQEAAQQPFPKPLPRILLALSRVPLPLIGSFAIDDGRVLESAK